MFVALDAPRFIVTGRVVQGQACFLTWGVSLRLQEFQEGRGASHMARPTC